MKKFLLALLIIVLLLASAFVFFVTKTFNADNFQSQIEQTVQEITGKKLTINGGTELNWRPMPTITLTNVTLANHAGSEYQNMMKAKSISVEIEWASLFQTPFKIKNVVLEDPVLILEKLETNQTNWHLPFFSKQKRFNDNLNAVITDTGTADTQIESIHIKNGQIQYINHINNLSLDLTDIDGNLSLTSLKGPFDFTGDLTYKGNRFGLKTHINRIIEDTPVQFTTQLSERKSEFILNLNGTITPHLSNSITDAVGEFTLQKPNTLFKLLGLPEIPTGADKPSLGNFTIESSLLKDHLKNLTIKLGNGDNALMFNFDIEFKKKTAQENESFLGSFAASQLDYALWKPVLSRFNWDFIGGGKSFPYTDLQINIPQLIYNKKTIRNFEVILTYDDDALLISDGKLTLPGQETETLFSGTALPTPDAPELTLDIQSKINNISEIKSWVNEPMIPDAIKNADLRVSLSVKPTEFSVLLNTVKIDNTNLTGYITRLTEGNLFRTNLSINNLDLDTYFKPAEKNGKTVLFTLPALLKQKMSQYPALEQANAQFNIKGINITWHALPMSAVDLNGQLNNGTLSFKKFDIQNVATGNLKITGDLSGFGNAPLRAENLAVNFDAKQLNLFLNRAQLDTLYPLINDAQNVQAQLQLSGSETTWQLDSRLKLSDTRLDFNGIFHNEQPLTRYENFAFTVSGPRFQEFLTALNITKNPFKNLDGNFNIQGVLNGTEEEFSLSNGVFNVGTERLSGSLAVKNQSILSVHGDLSTTLLNAERFLPYRSVFEGETGDWNTTNIPFDTLNLYDLAFKIRADELNYGLWTLENSLVNFTLKDKTLTLNELSGKHKKAPDSSLKITGQINWLNTPSVQTKFDIQRMPLRSNFMTIDNLFVGEGTGSINGEIKTTGRSVSDMIQNVDGSGKFEFDNNIIIGMDLKQTQDTVKTSLEERYTAEVLNTGLKRALSAGKTDLIHAAGKWDMTKGVIQSPNASLNTDVSTSNPMQIVWDLPQHSLNIQLPIRLTAYSELPQIDVLLKRIKNQSSYSVNTDALEQTLGHQIMQELSQTKLAATQQQNLKKAAEQQSRQDKINQAVSDAETAVKQAEQLAMRTPSERTDLLLQNAKDALSFVKTLAIKEQLTENQYNQLIEQSRLAVLRAQETESEILKNDLLETRRNILALSQYAQAALMHMQELQVRLPYAETIPLSIEQTQAELAKINAAADVLVETTNLDKINQTIIDANLAFQKIQELFENAKRLDPTVPKTQSDVNNTAIQGSFSRKTSAQ